MRLHRSFRDSDLNCMGYELSVFNRHGVDDDSVPDMEVAWRCWCAVLTKLRVGSDHHFDGGFRVGFNGDGFIRYLNHHWTVPSQLVTLKLPWDIV